MSSRNACWANATATFGVERDTCESNSDAHSCGRKWNANSAAATATLRPAATFQPHSTGRGGPVLPGLTGDSNQSTVPPNRHLGTSLVKLRIDTWDAEYGSSYEATDDATASRPPTIREVEGRDWAPVRPRQSAQPGRIGFVDGVRRVDVRLFAED